MLLASGDMLLAELAGMLSRLGSMLPVSKGMLSVAYLLLADMLLTGMLLAEVAGMLRKLLSVLPLFGGVLPLFGGVLPVSVSAMLKNSASATFTPAEYIKPFLDIRPFCSQKAISACSTAGSR
jgi:hypothetical protein